MLVTMEVMLTGFVAPTCCFRSALYFIACYFSRIGFQVCLLSCATFVTATVLLFGSTVLPYLLLL
jgi:hypothetical protein